MRRLRAPPARRCQRADAPPGASLAEGDLIAQTVAQIWQALLSTPAPGPEDDFFDVGGDSLKAVTFVVELETALGVELPLTLINEAPAFAALCEALRGHRTAGYVPLVPLKAGDGSPPVFFVHGIGGTVVDLFPIAQSMTWPGAVIGVQAVRDVRAPVPDDCSCERFDGRDVLAEPGEERPVVNSGRCFGSCHLVPCRPRGWGPEATNDMSAGDILPQRG